MFGLLLLSFSLCIGSPRQAHAIAQGASLSTNSGMRVLSQGTTEFGILLDTSYKYKWLALGRHLMPILHEFSDLHVNLFLPLKTDTEVNCVRPGEYHDQNSPRRRCSELCTNEARYCYSATLAEVEGPTVIEDSLDLVCLWQLYAYSDDFSPLQSYLNAQVEKGGLGFTTAVAVCLQHKDRESAMACRHDILTAAGIDMDALETCIVSSGGLDTGPNSILERSMNGTIDTMPHLAYGSIASIPQALCTQSNESAPTICAACHEDACRNQEACWTHLSCIDDICQQCDYDPVCWRQGTCPPGAEKITPVSPSSSINDTPDDGEETTPSAPETAPLPPEETPSIPNDNHDDLPEDKTTDRPISSPVDYTDAPKESDILSCDEYIGKRSGLDLGVGFVAGMAVAFLLMALRGWFQRRERNQPSYKGVDTAGNELELT